MPRTAVSKQGNRCQSKLASRASISSDHAELAALHKLDEVCAQYQAQGNYVAALDHMEKALVLRRHFFGPKSAEVLNAFQSAAELCNVVSLTYLQTEQYSLAFAVLKKAQALLLPETPQHRQPLADTFNNMACYYRRVCKTHSSLACLKKALAIEKSLHANNNVADTLLNICAVLSEIGKHYEALHHALEALALLQEEVFSNKEIIIPRVTVMCIAYHNIGVEHEFLHQIEACVSAYSKGCGVATRYLGEDSGVTITLRNSYLGGKRKLATRRIKKKSSTTGAGIVSIVPKKVKSLKIPKINTTTNIVTVKEEKTSRVAVSEPKETVTPKTMDEGAKFLSPYDPYFSPRTKGF